MTFGSLFSGIGGMDLGLERAGFECRWQVEIDPYARRVLAKHWPDVRRHDDVRTFPPDGDWDVDLIAGGFPCQDVSEAGSREGIDGRRSGLWREFARVVRLLRPRFVLVENVPGLLARGLGRVLGDLAALGYDAEWDCVSAAAVGAPHLRDRVFVLAYAGGEYPESARAGRDVACASLADQEARPQRQRLRDASPDSRPTLAFARPLGCEPGGRPGEPHGFAWLAREGHWFPEPRVGRLAHGLPSGVDESRLRTLGNAVVPQVAEWVGRRILESVKGVADVP